MINIDSCEEFYVIEKTIEIVVRIAGEPQTIRIEALRSLPEGSYSTRAFIQEHLTAQFTYPQISNKLQRKPVDIRVMIDYDLPWTRRESADGALNQALDFLRERCTS